MSAAPTRHAVLAVLDGITDPCSVAAGAPAGLVEMGLVVDLAVAADGAVALRLRVTDGLCLMSAVFVGEARARLAALPGVTTVDVTLDAASVWTPDDMAAGYRRRLEEHRAHRRA